MKISKRSKITSSKETADRKTDRRISPTNVRYKGYMICLDRGGDGYNVYDKNRELEDAGYPSREAAKKFIDELVSEAGDKIESSVDIDEETEDPGIAEAFIRTNVNDCSNVTTSKSVYIDHYNSFDNGHVLRDFKKMTEEQAQEEAKQASIKDPTDAYYVHYDDVMNPVGDIVWVNGTPYYGTDVHPKGKGIVIDEGAQPVQLRDRMMTYDYSDVEACSNVIASLNYVTPEMKQLKRALSKIYVDNDDQLHELVDSLLINEPINLVPETRALKRAIDSLVVDSEEERRTLVYEVAKDLGVINSSSNVYVYSADDTGGESGIYEETEDPKWICLDIKHVRDSDGMLTDYALYTTKDEDKYICMFGDADVYAPDEMYADAEFDTEDEALEWFENYVGPGDEEDEEYEHYDILESTEAIKESFSTKNVAKSKFKSINEDIDGTLNKLGGPETFRSELMATIEAYPGIEDDIEELADMMYGSYKGVISIEELESAIEYMIDDALESNEAVNSSYSPELLDDLVNFYSSFDTMSYEEIWDEIVVRYNNEALANDVIESLDDYDEEDEYDVYSSSDIKASMGRYDEYYGQTAAATYGDLIADRLKGREVSKRRDTANEPGGLIYEANKLGIDMWDLLEALEGMCNEGRAREIDDSTYKILGASDLADEDDLEHPDQEYDSAATSINSTKLPAIYRMIKLQPGTVGVDFGGGRFDNAVEYLRDQDVTLCVYDPYNRSAEHNREVLRTLRANGGADFAVNSNVLNVIKEHEARKGVLENIKKITKSGAPIYITVYEGRGDAKEGVTKSGYQLNRKTADYLEEIQEVFPDATRKGKLIVATNSGSVNSSVDIKSSSEIIWDDLDWNQQIQVMKRYIRNYKGARIFEDFADYINKPVEDIIDSFTDAESHEDIKIPERMQLDSEYRNDDIYSSTTSSSRYWYFTRHGVQPGSVPKYVNILDIVDKPEGSYFLADGVILTKDLRDYDIKERKPEDSVTSSTRIEYSDILEEIREQCNTKLIHIMAQYGFDESEAKQYSRVDASIKDNQYGRIEIGCELDYDGLMRVCQELDTIVQAYDPDSYFEPVDSGIAEAWVTLEKASIDSSSNIQAGAYDFPEPSLDPPEYPEPEEGEETVEVECDINQLEITVDEDGSWEYQRDDFLDEMLTAEDEITSEEYDVYIRDRSGLIEDFDSIVEPNIPGVPGTYLISCHVKMVYDVTGVEIVREYQGKDEDGDPIVDEDYYTGSSDVEFNRNESYITNFYSEEI